LTMPTAFVERLHITLPMDITYSKLERSYGSLFNKI